jgi:two-component sensor histidine kinase
MLRSAPKPASGAARASGVNEAGFGTRLIDTSIRGLRGVIRRDWQPSGLACEIKLPHEQVFVAGTRE